MKVATQAQPTDFSFPGLLPGARSIFGQIWGHGGVWFGQFGWGVVSWSWFNCMSKLQRSWAEEDTCKGVAREHCTMFTLCYSLSSWDFLVCANGSIEVHCGFFDRVDFLFCFVAWLPMFLCSIVHNSSWSPCWAWKRDHFILLSSLSWKKNLRTNRNRTKPGAQLKADWTHWVRVALWIFAEKPVAGLSLDSFLSPIFAGVLRNFCLLLVPRWGVM